jgi:RNA polymerase sigma-54 factor
MANQSFSLSQQLRLQQVLAPQLRQSLEMLQMPMLELRAMIQHELEQNPTLEEGVGELPAEAQVGDGEPDMALPFDQMEPAIAPVEHPESDGNQKEVDALTRLDESWRELESMDGNHPAYGDEYEEKRRYLMESLTEHESLQEHLMNQLQICGMDEAGMQIGELIIGNLSDDGYFTMPAAELAASAAVDVHQVEDTLAIIQDFHPVGIAARNLSECLLIQLDRIGTGHTIAARIVRSHLEDLAQKKIPEIARALEVPVSDVYEAAKQIAALNPKPGHLYTQDVSAYIAPEITVSKVDGRYVVLNNDDDLPHIRISAHYRHLLEDPATTPEVRQYIQDKIRAGAFLIKSIQQRQRTIRRIASEIVITQTDFLEHGVSHLKPLTMAEVAKIVGVHETTVSRAVSGKYLQTPRGIYELKFFFTPAIQTSDGKSISNKSVQDMISTLVSGEDHAHPLSDQDLMEALQKQGVPIARRTIAKYRLMLKIPPSHLRKVE